MEQTLKPRKRTGRQQQPGYNFNVKVPMAVADRVRLFSDMTGLSYTQMLRKLIVDHIDEVTPENYGVKTDQLSLTQLEVLHKIG
ncbi:hypothetical protein ACUH9Y_02515 [Dermabacteraceae bacterium P13115]